MKICTLTLNPAYDIHAECNSLELCRESTATLLSRDAGGKGVNISRALSFSGIDNTAIVILGSENCEDFKRSLASDGINAIYIEKNGRIRENLTLHHGKNETRISFQGFSVDNALLSEAEKLIDADKDTILTFTGSIPKGIDKEEAKELLLRVKSKGARIVIDSRSFDINDIFDIKPWLIKPNGEEVEVYAQRKVSCTEDCLDFGRKCLENGVENTLITLGGDGAVLFSKEGIFSSAVPQILPVSTIGAGDSAIAGFIAAYLNKSDAASALKASCAYGSAACLTEGTNPPMTDDIERLYAQIKISRI